MAVDFKNSRTRENLMRAFAGECQARARYTLAAGEAKNKDNFVIEAIFRFTAEQEKEHAERFYKFLKECNGDNVQIDGSYPVNVIDDLISLLHSATHNEYEEHDTVYQSFGDIAKEEGFSQIAQVFYMIAGVEKTHGDRFAYFEQLLKDGKLFVSDVKVRWMCLNCGYVLESTKAPAKCPVCEHDQGYFIRLELAPYEVIPCKD